MQSKRIFSKGRAEIAHAEIFKHPFKPWALYPFRKHFPSKFSSNNTEIQNQETTHSRIRYTAGKGNPTFLTTFAFTAAVEVYVKIPIFWTLSTTAMVLQQRNNTLDIIWVIQR